MSTMSEKTDNHDFKAEPAGSSDASTGSGVVEEADIDIDSEWTAAEEKAIRRKFDLTITPLVTILYMCCAIDRANIGNAKIEGMATDLNLVGYRYNIILSIFFIVYLSVEVPSNVILKYFGPRYYMPFLVFSFGLVSLCTAFVQSYAGLAVTRARNIFFFEGLATILLALGATYFMPQGPGNWKYLTPRQQYIAAERIRREHDANPKEKVSWHHVRQAIFNVHTQVCAWCFFCTNSCVQGMGAFIPTILKEFGWTSTKAQLMSVPPYLVACILTVALGYASDRTNRRGVFMLGALLFSITGFCILRFSDDIHAKYGAVYLNAIGVFAASSGFLSWGINNTASPAVAAVAGGYMVSIGSIGGVLSTWTYLSTDSPKFHIGHSINFSLQLVCFALAAFGLLHCKYENKIRALGRRDTRLEGLSEESIRRLGHKHPSFRYME
ncbi:MFS general substrate transporter [Coniochaeta sp. PMI_546]|nr:MFS general substrate transporter [Coniochaeta sp. PMI_546]